MGELNREIDRLLLERRGDVSLGRGACCGGSLYVPPPLLLRMEILWGGYDRCVKYSEGGGSPALRGACVRPGKTRTSRDGEHPKARGEDVGVREKKAYRYQQFYLLAFPKFRRYGR